MSRLRLAAAALTCATLLVGCAAPGPDSESVGGFPDGGSIVTDDPASDPATDPAADGVTPAEDGTVDPGLAGPTTGELSYAPAAYGQGPSCYYVVSRAEALALIAQGLCAPGTVPAAMPLAWRLRYWDYYASPAYGDAYVPAAARTAFTVRTASVLRSYATQIARARTTTSYVGSDGQPYSGASVLRAVKAGGAFAGTRSGTTSTGTSVRSGSGSRPGTTSRTGSTSRSGSTGRSGRR